MPLKRPCRGAWEPAELGGNPTFMRVDLSRYLVLVGDDVLAVFGTAEFARIVGLSLRVSFSATAVAAVVALPFRAALT